jgi:hypothetical protein
MILDRKLALDGELSCLPVIQGQTLGNQAGAFRQDLLRPMGLFCIFLDLGRGIHVGIAEIAHDRIAQDSLGSRFAPFIEQQCGNLLRAAISRVTSTFMEKIGERTRRA